MRSPRTFAVCFFDSRRAVAVVLLLSLLGGASSYSQVQQPDDHSGGTISGTVVNSVTHEPVGRALVYTADERHATFTDDHGHFDLTMPEPQANPAVLTMANSVNMLVVKKPGYLSESQTQARTMVNQSQKEVRLSLAPEGLIVGQVKFPSSEAADRAQVVLYRREVRDGFGRWEQVRQVQTRSDGEFRFAELRAGDYKVFTLEAVERDPLANVPNGPVFGFPPRFFPAARDFVTADIIQVHTGETVTANLSPERQRYYEVRIPVIKNGTGPETGLAVTVHAQGHRGPGFELGFDPNQNAIRGSLPNGSYTVEGASYEPDAATGITTITVANAPVNAPPLVLSPNTTIEINVRHDLTGAEDSQIPPSPPYVSLQSAEEFSAERGAGISYQSQGNPPALTGVKPGRYWVQVQVPTNRAYAASVTSGGKDLLRTPLVVPFGDSLPAIDITVRYDNAEIEATVEGEPVDSAGAQGTVMYSPQTNPEYQPGTGASVYCVPLANDGGAARWFNGRVNGRYVLPEVPPGDYRILAFRTPQQLEYRNPAAMRAYESKGQVVHLAPGQKAQVRLQVIENE